MQIPLLARVALREALVQWQKDRVVSGNRNGWFFAVCLLIVGPIQAFNQCVPSCMDITYSLPENCSDTILVEDIWSPGMPAFCLDSFYVELYDLSGNLLPTSPAINGDWIGGMVEARLKHVSTVDSCTSLVTVVDDSSPMLQCTDTLINCFTPILPENIGYPSVMDNCYSSISLNYIDNVFNYDCITNDTIQVINRLWTALDGSNNVDNCIQQIFVTRPGLASLSFPPNLDGLQSAPLYCQNADTSPANTGMPMYNGIPVNNYCFFSTDYVDVVVPGCGGSYQLFREWEITDECNNVSISKTQIIEVLDTVPPILTCLNDFEIETNNLDCTATLVLPTPSAFDECGGPVFFLLSTNGGLVDSLTIYNLPSGTFDATLYAADACGNIDSCSFMIEVVDVVPPVAISVGNANISLLPSEPTFVNAITFDDGSWDNCGPITLNARRLDAPHCPGNDATIFGPTVPFFCCDAEQTVEVEIRVMDLEGNTSTATSLVQVVDNLNPGILCPDNLVLDCTEDYTNLNITGSATASDNCPGFQVGYQDSTIIGSCGDGEVYRKWTVTDAFGRSTSCTQVIIIMDQDIFFINPVNPEDPNDDIIWPLDYEAPGCGEALHPDALPLEHGWPQIVADTTCSMVAISYFDEFLNSPSNCAEVLREWTVIDWCQFDPNTGVGIWSYFQQIQVPESQAPLITSPCDTVIACSQDVNCITGQLEMEITAMDDCSAPSELVFMHEIDFFGDGQVEITQFGADIDKELPIGSHLVTAIVTDGCGQTASCTFTVIVQDCMPPTGVCQNRTVDLSPFGTTLLASSFNLASFDNCSSNNDLQYSFAADTLIAEIPLNCTWLGEQGMVIWVSDELGNETPCGVTLTVQDPDTICGNGAISGGLVTEQGFGLQGATITLESNSGQMVQQTDLLGDFSFPDLTVGQDYLLYPFLDEDWDNGVTTFDEVLITKHILGLLPLNSPYKVIAADVNHSGTVTTLDVVQLKKIILLLETSVPNNTSWRFVDSNYEFVNPAAPLNESFPEQIVINGLLESLNLEFVAIKVGDVNGSAMTQ